jgi:hypothetical protein
VNINATQQLLEMPRTGYGRCFQQWKATRVSVYEQKGPTLKGISPSLRLV